MPDDADGDADGDSEGDSEGRRGGGEPGERQDEGGERTVNGALWARGRAMPTSEFMGELRGEMSKQRGGKGEETRGCQRTGRRGAQEGR